MHGYESWPSNTLIAILRMPNPSCQTLGSKESPVTFPFAASPLRRPLTSNVERPLLLEATGSSWRILPDGEGRYWALICPSAKPSKQSSMRYGP